ncbi:MAG: TonB-dependent receptor [Xanthomonadales bacterium]|nr:TonB-dependent receptor [Xanthomonadales bacterium]
MKTSQGLPQNTHKLQLKPLARAIVQHRCLMQASLLLASTSLAISPVMAQTGDGLVLEEILVTAQKRDQNLQDVPVSVMALTAKNIEDLGITNFGDYVLQFPNIAFKSFGHPGGATIYMRGVADGGDGNPSGSTPSVSLYLDEQPVTSIGSNLDIHIYDVERIEALGGPQGTLFGASSQSGVVRIITNKPDPSGFTAGFDLNGFGTKGGDGSYSVEGFANIPMGEQVALRVVAWYEDEGGWIDNIAGERTYRMQGPGAGYGYNPNTAIREITINNNALVEDDFNDLKRDGLRAALRVNLNDTWTSTLGVITQDTKTHGVWEYDPNLPGKDQIQRYHNEYNKDKFTQYSLTVEGDFDNAQLVYAGAYLDRHVDYQTDYSAYGVDAYFVPYYACDYYASADGLCSSLYEYYFADTKTTRNSQEVRLVSTGDNRLQYTVGVFYEQTKQDYFLKWIQPGMSPSLQVPDSTPGLFFRTDQNRTDLQVAAFGELTYNITDSLALTGGARYYDETHKVTGVVGWGPGNYCPDDPTCRDTNADSETGTNGWVFKGNLAWTINDDAMIYATFSQGYRPGGLNRDPSLPSQPWEPDKLTNYEFGWKTTMDGGRLRWNGAAYLMDWDNVQYTVYNFSLSACCANVYNLSTARVKGIETDISFLASEALTLSGGLAYNKAETTADFILPSGRLSVPEGTQLPNVPKWKFNLLARYDFSMSDMPLYAQADWSFTGKSTSEIAGTIYPQHSYDIVNLRTGIDKDTWGLDLFVNNLLNTKAELYVHPRNYEPTVVTNRPLNYGLRYWMRF